MEGSCWRYCAFGFHSKAIGLQYRVSEILARLGVVDRFLAQGGSPTSVNLYADANGNISKPPAGRPQPDGTNPMAPGTPPGAEADAPKSRDNNKTPAEAGKITD